MRICVLCNDTICCGDDVIELPGDYKLYAHRKCIGEKNGN